MKIIRKVALAYFKDRKLIMVRSHKNTDVFYNLGGKVEEGESDVDCLLREVKEEVSGSMDKTTIQFLHEFEEEAHGKENAKLTIRLYRGNLINEPKASSEIAEIGYFDSTARVERVTIMGKAILEWLKNQGYID